MRKLPRPFSPSSGSGRTVPLIAVRCLSCLYAAHHGNVHTNTLQIAAFVHEEHPYLIVIRDLLQNIPVFCRPLANFTIL